MWAFLGHIFGLDNLSGAWYGFWSGIAGDLSSFAIFGGLYALMRKHNCDVHGCWRLGQKQTNAIVVASGVTVTTGHIADNDLRGNLTGTFSQSGTLSGVVMRDNVGYTPTITQPGVPTSTTVYTNTFGCDCEVHITGGTVTVIAVNGITTGVTSGTFMVRALSTIAITYSIAPTWVWIPQG